MRWRTSLRTGSASTCAGAIMRARPHDIDLTKIIKIVFDVRAQGIALEAANPRHAHEWAVWKEITLPDDKLLLPGVIDTSTNYVEHPALVAERIVKFANVVGRERVIAKTDCGFGTAAGYGELDPEVVYLKLGLARCRRCSGRQGTMGLASPWTDQVRRCNNLTPLPYSGHRKDRLRLR